MEHKESFDLDFSHYLLSLKRRFVPATCVFIITVTLAAVASIRLSKPSYQASGKLLFKLDPASLLTSVRENKGGDEEKKISDLTPLVSTQNPISTEIEVINSTPILQDTINGLNLKNKKGEPLKPEDIQKQLSIKIIGGTDLVRLTYVSRDPKEAATVVNKLMNSYIENNIITDRAGVSAAREFIAKQLPQTEATVRQAEVKLRRFKEQNNVVDLPEEAKSAVTAIATLESQITTVQANLQEANAQSAGLRNKVGLNSQDAIAVSSLSQSPAVQGILQELHEVEKKLATERARFQDQSPTIVSLEEKKAALETLLQQQIKQVVGSQTQVPDGLLQIGELRQSLIKEFLQAEVQRFSIAQRLDSLSKSRAAYQQRTTLLPRLEQDQRELQRRLDAAQATYAALLKKLQEVQVEQNKKTTNARIVEPAQVPDKPLSGSKAKIMALGVMLGALLFTITVLLLEMRDNSLKTLKELKQLFGYPLLGAIPSFRRKLLFPYWDAQLTVLDIPVRDTPHSSVSEMYRMIQANLKFLSSDKKLKTFVVTSSVPKEGKSTISANLAVAIAQLGRQVLLIDANMRHPSQEHVWGLTNVVGLSEVIVGQANFWAAACKVTDNLDVLTSGVMPPNPLALLDSESMASLIKLFSDKYDLVIIDAPPLIHTADALTLGHMTDGILLVARLGGVDSASVKAAKEMLERSGQNVLGLVVNGVIQKNASTGEKF